MRDGNNDMNSLNEVDSQAKHLSLIEYLYFWELFSTIVSIRGFGVVWRKYSICDSRA